MVTQERRRNVSIPPLEHQSYSLRVQLRIYQDVTRYGMDIQVAEGPPQRIPIEMKPHDLRDLNRRLQGRLQDIGSANVEDNQLTLAEMEAQILPLAEVGHYAFKRVFGGRGIWESLQTLLTPGQRISVQVTSDAFFLPWELLYPASLEEPLSYEHFWGMNYIISRVIPQDFHPGAFVSPEISFAFRPKVGLLTYEGLVGVERQEMPFFDRLKWNNEILLFKMHPLDPDRKQDGLRELKDFLSKAYDLIHLACHASYDDEAHSLSHILLSNEFPVTLEDIENYDVAIDSNPLIIMNACETGNLNPLYTANFAAAFLKLGARGVVATECVVPDSFAADFAQRLYTHLLAGEPLGESLLATRRHFLEEQHNLSGLLYSMYAPPSIRLAQVGGQDEQQ